MRFVVFAISFLCAIPRAHSTNTPVEKILQVSVTESGLIYVGRDTVNSDDLARYIQERLFKSYLGTGQMQREIRFAPTAAVPETVVDVVKQEIEEGQHRALTELCLARYKKKFDTLDTRQQTKIRRQFPVLFQPISKQSPGV